MFLFDAHLDLAMNAMEWNRDLRLPVSVSREREKNMTDQPDRQKGTVAFPELRQANIGLVVATQIARYAAPGHPLPGWHSPEQAWAQTQAQLSWYRCMEAAGELTAITDKTALEKHLAAWMQKDADGMNLPIGYVRSLEGADSLVTLHYLHQAYEQGLRAVGPAHYGPGRYASGTDASAPLSDNGKALLREMESLNMLLDVSHLCDLAFFEALDIYKGPLWASHSNPRSLVPHNRQISDEMIRLLIERDSAIGIALDAWMLVPNWERGLSQPAAMQCTLDTVVQHIDYVCQLAGNSLHVGIGSDLDGAFGTEQCPADLNTIADLPKIKALLFDKGYREEDCANIFYKNFLRILRKSL
ncbi:MAG TPA: membrane dipeptidase [Sediminibacterium sp.]|nr:membrane dipeptidase [Sediminibacterium sp.]